MNNYRNYQINNKGFTLVELVIVLVLLSIISLMFITFSTLSSEHTISITNENQVLEDVSSIKELFSDWIALFDSDEYSFYIIKTNDIIYHEDAEEDLEVQTDILYAYKNSDYEDFITTYVPNSSNPYYDFVTSDTYSDKVYRFYLSDNGNVIGTNPDEDKNLLYNGTLYINYLNFTIEKNENNQNVLLVKLELNYQYPNALTKKEVVTSIDFYKATKCAVGYGGMYNVEY